MKVSLKAILWTDKEDKNGQCPIAIYISGGGKKAYYNTGIKVAVKFWDKGTILKGSPNYDIQNNRLSSMIKDAERELLNKELQGEQFDLDDVKRLFQTGPTKSIDFYKYALKIIASKDDSTKRRYSVEIEKLQKKYKKLSFCDITPKWLTAYYKHLTGPEVGNSTNTAINAFKVIRLVFNVAIEDKVFKYYPFDEWDYPKYKAPLRPYLTTDECEKLFKLLDRVDVSADMKLVTAFFLLECFSGIRVSDWGKFKIEKVVDYEDMVFTTTKTKTDVRLPLDLMPSLNRIVGYIRDHKLHYDKDGAFANSKLNDIAALAGIVGKPLTTHIARHSFATQCLAIGMDIPSIAIAMGITTKQVMTYAKVTPDKIRTSLKRIGGGV